MSENWFVYLQRPYRLVIWSRAKSEYKTILDCLCLYSFWLSLGFSITQQFHKISRVQHSIFFGKSSPCESFKYFIMKSSKYLFEMIVCIKMIQLFQIINLMLVLKTINATRSQIWDLLSFFWVLILIFPFLFIDLNSELITLAFSWLFLSRVGWIPGFTMVLPFAWRTCQYLQTLAFSLLKTGFSLRRGIIFFDQSTVNAWRVWTWRKGLTLLCLP